jgi:Sulfotransferase domain
MGVEVIGAGFGRTGTSSFKEALEILGFGKCYHMKIVVENGHAPKWLEFSETKDPKLISDLLDKGGFRSTSDHPACMFWHEQLKMYPNAKVVITVRDPNSWYKSWMDTVACLQPDCETCPFGTRVFMGMNFFRSFAKMTRTIITYGTFNGDWSKGNMIKCYNDHIEKVKLLCPPEKLLLFNVKDGWAPLCKFLEVPIPDRPYPHLNSTKEFKLFALALNMIGWIVTILGCGLPAVYRMDSKIDDPKKMSSNIE